MGKKRRDGRASKRGNNSASNDADARNSGGGELQRSAARYGIETIRYSGGIYNGQLMNGKPHGKGGLRWEDGGFCEGYWKEGTLHGWGVMSWPSGQVYDGQWENGKENGRGTMTFASGSVYEGEFKKGAITGSGTMKYATGRTAGSMYEGQWVQGVKNGKGTLTSATGEIYEGIWVRGELVSAESTNHVLPPDNAITALKANCELLDGRKMRSIRSQERRVEADTKTCEHCGVDDFRYKLRVCSGCNLALYCSAACQKAASRSRRRICDIVSELPRRDANRLALAYDRDKMVDLDAGLRYATKYMDNVKHLQINLEKMSKDDTAKLSAKQLSSLLGSKKGALNSVFWRQKGSTSIPGVSENGYDVWKELHGLKQLCLCLLQFDDAQCLNDIIDQQRDTLEVLTLPMLGIDWSKAKTRRAIAQAVSACKHLVKLDLQGCVLMDSDLKSMLHDLPNLRILRLRRDTRNSHEFTDNTCGLIARKCSGLQELNLTNHDQLSVRGIRKIFESCTNLRSFGTSTCKLSCKDLQGLLDIAPQMLYLYLGDTITNDEASQIIEATGGRTVLQISGSFALPDGVSTKAREKYDCQIGVINSLCVIRRDPEVANEWAGMFEG
ncbi:hypothetical protein ACHAXT_001310 [Thalassiosira profunda]